MIEKIMVLIVIGAAIADSVVLCLKAQKKAKRSKLLMEIIHSCTGGVLSACWFAACTNYEKNSVRGIFTVTLGSIYFLTTCVRILNAIACYRELPQNKTVRKAMKRLAHLKQEYSEKTFGEVYLVNSVINGLDNLYRISKDATKLTESTTRVWECLLNDFIRVFEKYLHTKKSENGVRNEDNIQTLNECCRKFSNYLEQAYKEQEELNHEESYIQSLDFQADAEIFVSSMEIGDFNTQPGMYIEETEKEEDADDQKLQQMQI